MAKQGKNLKVAGCVVLGLIRDIEEIHELGLPVSGKIKCIRSIVVLL